MAGTVSSSGETASSRFRSERDPGLTLGDRVTIHNWCAFSVEPSGRVFVGDDTVLVGAIFMCADSISIGARCLVSYNVTIADSDFHPMQPGQRRIDAVAISPGSRLVGRVPLVTRPVVIGDDVTIGIGAMILKGVTIGAGATIDAGTVVTRDVPPGAHVSGNPALVAQ